MPSAKHRTSSNSGASRKSKPKADTSGKAGNTSATSPASFAEVFGKGQDPEEKELWARAVRLKEAALARLGVIMAKPEPRLPYPAQLRQQTIQRHHRQIRKLEEFIGSLTNPTQKTDNDNR